MNSIITNPPATQEGIGIQTAVLTADFPKTNDTLTAVTGWSTIITLEAGKTYRVTAVFVASLVAVAAQVDLDGGTSVFDGMSGSMWFYDSDVASFNEAVPAVGNTGVAGGAGGYVLPFHYDVVIEVATGGTFIPRFAQITPNATASTLLKYSTISAQEISPTPTY